MKKGVRFDDDAKLVLEKLRGVCMRLPGTTEQLSWGNPTFKAGGKAYAALDNYKGATCVWFRCDKLARAKLLKDEAFFPSPYDKAQVALCRIAGNVSWREMSKLIRASYESVIAG